MSETLALRNADIVARFDAGETLQAIGLRYGVVRERIRQIVTAAGRLPCRKLAEEVDEDLRRLVGPGPVYSDQALEFGFRDAGQFYRFLHRHAIPFIRRRKHSESEIASLAEKVRSGASVRSLCPGDRTKERRLRAYCASIGIVSRFAERRHVAGAPKAFAPEIIRAATIREAALLNRGRAPASAIAAVHGCSRNAIIGHWSRLRQQGVIA